MNREIIFRAWDKINKKMILPDEENAKYWKSFPILPACDFSLCRGVLWNKKRANNYILMQFTGLKDKKGKEIYEGDILRGKSFNKDKGYKTIVEYKDGAFIVDACSGDYDATSIGFAIEDGFEFEVIGNIYENKIK